MGWGDEVKLELLYECDASMTVAGSCDSKNWVSLEEIIARKRGAEP